MPIETKSYPIETLHGDSFLSLRNFKFEVKNFNVITGDMASGKSLILKALEFFNNIFEPLMNIPYDKLIENLEINIFHKIIIRDFMIRFNLKEDIIFDIGYSCSFNDTKFCIKLFRKKNEERISIESEFLKKQLEEWKNYIKDWKPKKSEKFTSHYEFSWLKSELYNILSGKFGYFYPSATIFVPATRAALATRAPLATRVPSSSTDKLNFQDYYLNLYEGLIEAIKPLPETKYRKEVNEILKAIIKINGDFHLLSNDREVDIGYASSGQQESFYILLLLEKLPILRNYYKNCNIYIEEPEAHLFPFGQKRILELIVQIFNSINSKSKRSPIKFHITTHSPYVLNTINNMLIKGSMSDNEEMFNEIKNIPPLDYKETSAIFINDEKISIKLHESSIKDILERYEENYFLINPDAINDIAISINNDTNLLKRLKAKAEKLNSDK